MPNLFREAKAFDEWFAECAAAIRHNDDDWVTAREMISDFAALGSEFGGKLVADHGPDRKHEFRKSLYKVLALFAKGKLLRKQPKAIYLANLGAHSDGRMPDEDSYKISNFGARLLQRKVFLRCSYIFGILFCNLSVVLLRRYKWVIGIVSGIVSVVTFLLRAAEIFEAAIVAVVIAILVIIATAIIRGYNSSID